jgi:hypothetical protein
MFKFNLATLEDRDLRDSVSAMELFLSIAGQRNNPCFEYLRDLMKAEVERRQDADADDDNLVDVELPLFEATDSHYWALVKVCCGIVETAAKGQPAAMGVFYGSIVNQIQAYSERMASAVNN